MSQQNRDEEAAIMREFKRVLVAFLWTALVFGIAVLAGKFLL